MDYPNHCDAGVFLVSGPCDMDVLTPSGYLFCAVWMRRVYLLDWHLNGLRLAFNTGYYSDSCLISFDCLSASCRHTFRFFPTGSDYHEKLQIPRNRHTYPPYHRTIDVEDQSQESCGCGKIGSDRSHHRQTTAQAQTQASTGKGNTCSRAFATKSISQAPTAETAAWREGEGEAISISIAAHAGAPVPASPSTEYVHPAPTSPACASPPTCAYPYFISMIVARM